MKEISYRALIAITIISIITPLFFFSRSQPVFAQDENPNPGDGEATPTYGPDLADFPPGYNPLTGLPVSDPENLNLPVVLISVTNYPVSARPQAGPSFAPYIYEIFISEGMTRWLTLFYGDYPEPNEPISGECPIRTDPFNQTGLILGNFIWHDGNGDGKQSLDEGPISGVCVNLFDAETDELIETTSTDSNGFYGFNVEEGKKYYIKYAQPAGMVFTDADVGEDDFADSDADKETGQTPIISITQDNYTVDVGFVKDAEAAGLENGGEPSEGSGGQTTEKTNEDGGVTITSENSTIDDWKKPGDWIGNYVYDTIIGPVRSGRLPYKYVREWFYSACLIYAGKSAEVDIPGCASVFGSDETDINSAFLSVTRLKEIAKQSQKAGETLDYSGNAYLNLPSTNGPNFGPDPQGLTPSGVANEIIMFYNFLNQAKWVFDPLSGGYLRYTDLADGTGDFYPATDRLNGRQLIFNNIIVVFARHSAIQPTIIDIHIDFEQGPAILFRDGKAYKIVWNTFSDDQAQETGRNRPMKFVDSNGNPVPLHPGQTWVHIVTQTTSGYEKNPGFWYIRFYAPEGAK